MWRDAEEGLTHDDERQDVKERIWGQIVKIHPVVEHETPYKGVKGESESGEEVGINTTLSPGSGVGMTCARSGSLCLISVVSYRASRSSLMFSSMMEEGTQFP